MCSREDFGRIAVLAGGPSSERDISLKSGRAVYRALRAEGLDVKWLDVGGKNAKGALEDLRFDVAFVALHGRFGEDGSIQRILERMSKPYTGSGVRASKRALDKITSRKIFEKLNIPVPDYAVLKKPAHSLPEGFGFPVIVKPQNQGSSIGLSLAKNERDFGKACGKAYRYSAKIIVEKFIKAREITVGILGGRPLPVVEIKPRRRFYDYKAKYSDTKTRYEVPAPISPHLYKKAQRLGLAAYRALGCSDFSRVDMLLDRRNRIYVLEVNTIPGLTERSLLPKAARADGMDFSELCVKLIELAVMNKGKKI